MRRVWLIPILICLSIAAARAQDQVEIISDPPQVLTGPAPNMDAFGPDAARSLIANTLKADTSDPNFYCIIHLLRWKDDQAAIAADKWFVFRGGPNWTTAGMENTRIFGSHNVAVLYVHLNTPVVSNPDLAIDASDNPGQFRKDLTAGRLSRFQDEKGRGFTRLGNVLIVSGYGPVTYRVEVKKKLPFPLANLASLVGMPQAGAAEKLTLPTAPTPLWAGRVLNIKPLPCDLTVHALLGLDSQELAKQTFDDEGLYRWDVSVALPLRSTKEVQYDSTNGTLLPKTVDKLNAYGLFNFFLKPIDTKSNRPIWPFPVAGVSITGKPLDRTMVGIGWGISRVQGFVGCAFNKVAQPTQEAAPGGTTTLTTRTGKYKYYKKLIFGVNLTMRQVLDLMKAAK